MEQLPVLCQTTVAVGGYTAGSGVLNVVSTAAGSGLLPFPVAATFSVVISDPVTFAPKALLEVTAISSATQFAVVNSGGVDANCNAGDLVQAVLDARALQALLNTGGQLVLLSRQTASGTPSSITFSSIPATYSNLLLVVTARGTTAATDIDLDVQFNGDNGANYTHDFILEQNAVVSGGAASAQTFAFVANISAANAVANAAGIIKSVIPQYSGTTFIKAILSESFNHNGAAIGGVRQILTNGNYWNSTAAITSIKLFPSAGNLVNGSVFELWAQ